MENKIAEAYKKGYEAGLKEAIKPMTNRERFLKTVNNSTNEELAKIINSCDNFDHCEQCLFFDAKSKRCVFNTAVIKNGKVDNSFVLNWLEEVAENE